MKRKVVEAPVVDRNYILELHASIHERLLLLDRLNEDYKARQEDHFIHSFMNVVQKMGNDLVLAQEAYRNIDIEVKRDQYCIELAAELQFFRTSCFQLKTALEKSEKALLALRIEKENDDTEMASVRLSLEKKIQENMSLKAENKDLARKIRQLASSKDSSLEKQFSSTDQRNYRAFKEEGNQRGSIKDRRMLLSQGAKRSGFGIYQAAKGTDERLTDSHTPNSQFLNQCETSCLVNPASFRRRPHQKGANRAASDLFK